MANSDGMSKDEIRRKAAELLEAAGVDPTYIPELVANEQAAARVVDSPTTSVAAAVQARPSPAYTAYGQYVQGFAPVSPSGFGVSAGIGQGVAPPVQPNRNYQVDGAGRILYNNGVLYDPNATSGSDILMPQNDPEAQGSLAWFQKVQEQWKEGKVESWRKRLLDLGYGEVVQGLASKGGWDQAFKSALAMYHQDRYRNFGKPLPVGQGTSTTKESFGGALDPDVLKQEVSMWFQEAYGDDPSDDEAEFWARKLKQTAMRLAQNKGMDPGAAVTVAQAKTQNRFKESPDVAEQIESNEEDEMDERMRSSLISVSQLSSI